MTGPTPMWTVLADALLHREAAAHRAASDGPPDPLAGLRIEGGEVDRLLTSLTGADAAEPFRRAADRSIAAARAAFREALEAPTVFAVIVANAAMSPDEAEVFSVLCAVELDPRRQRLVAYLQDDVTKPRLALHTLSTLFGPDHLGPLAVAADGRARRAGLLEVDREGPWAARTVGVAAPVVWALVGDTAVDADLPHEAELLTGPPDPTGKADLLLVTGDDRARRLELALAEAGADRFLLTTVPTGPEGWEALVRAATVGGVGLIVEVDGELPVEGRWWIERSDHLVWVVSSRTELPLDRLPGRPWVEHRASAAPVTDEEWVDAVGEAEPRRHQLTAEQLRLVRVAHQALGGDVDAAVRRLASGELERLANHVRPRRDWDDLVLTPDRTARLRELAARYRRRDVVYRDWGFQAIPSGGLVALFSGPSGTGKTLAAEVIAGDLGLDLYKLDLSTVVSKYIGETEKNLERVFNAAAAGNLVLFFDEADALFGKRSEVADAHDRYANIEVSYLLQRLESYDGLVVLATNLQKNIDSAFLRRIHVQVEFPLPEERERRRIWQRCLPPTAPLDGIDFDFLARQFKLAGGAIRSASLSAAFLAADAGGSITMETIVLGLKREYQKLGRLRTKADFDRYFELVDDGD